MIHPKLKVGARARITQGLASKAGALLPFIDGNHDLDDIAERTGEGRARVESLIDQLHAAGALDLRESRILLTDRKLTKVQARAMRSKRSIPDAIYAQLQMKMAPELSLLAWRDGVDDGGVEMLAARRRWEIEVGGVSRITALLATILIASGVTHTRLTVSDRGARNAIGYEDLACGPLVLSDVGTRYINTIHERMKTISLFPIDEGEEQELEFLRIYCGEPTLEQLSSWEQRNERYCIIADPIAAGVTVGPLVIPGVTPCLRCVRLHGSFDQQNSLDGYQIPVAQTHAVAALVVDQVLRFIDTGRNEIVGSEIFCDFLNPLQMQRQEFLRHPHCGCAFAT